MATNSILLIFLNILIVTSVNSQFGRGFSGSRPGFHSFSRPTMSHSHFSSSRGYRGISSIPSRGPGGFTSISSPTFSRPSHFSGPRSFTPSRPAFGGFTPKPVYNHPFSPEGARGLPSPLPGASILPRGPIPAHGGPIPARFSPDGARRLPIGPVVHPSPFGEKPSSRFAKNTTTEGEKTIRSRFFHRIGNNSSRFDQNTTLRFSNNRTSRFYRNSTSRFAQNTTPPISRFATISTSKFAHNKTSRFFRSTTPSIAHNTTSRFALTPKIEEKIRSRFVHNTTSRFFSTTPTSKAENTSLEDKIRTRFARKSSVEDSTLPYSKLSNKTHTYPPSKVSGSLLPNITFSSGFSTPFNLSKTISNSSNITSKIPPLQISLFSSDAIDNIINRSKGLLDSKTTQKPAPINVQEGFNPDLLSESFNTEHQMPSVHIGMALTSSGNNIRSNVIEILSFVTAVLSIIGSVIV